MNARMSKSIVAAVLATSALAILPAPATADTTVKVGVLSCEVEAGSGFIVGSRKDMSCVFESTSGYVENYTGTVKKFGIDIGTTDRTTIKWIVFAPTRDLPQGSLRGNYGGLSAEATAGYGLGANAMIGGSQDTIVLQPFSGQVQEGLNIAIGIGTMSLS